MNRMLFTSVLLLVSAIRARADGDGYGGTHQAATATGTLTFHHVHNWDSPKVDFLFRDLTHHERFFTAANDFAFVELRDGGTVLFRSPSPALTDLWISPDAQFVIGLSHVMLSNPYQLVVWQRDGTLVHREHISAEVANLSPDQRRDFANRFPDAERFLSGRYFAHRGATYLDYSIPGIPNKIGDAACNYLVPFLVQHPYSDDFSSSVTNWVEWFDRKNPDVSIARSGTQLSVSLRSPNGKRLTIPIQK